MNLNDGRNYFPSSQTENLVEKLLINRHTPGTLLTQQHGAEVIGDNKVSVLNQAVQGGANVMNLQVNGPIRGKEPVPVRNVIMTKYENKRRDTEQQEALYNIRQADDRFIYGNYLDQQLAEKAKQKVFNKPSINFREQVKDVHTFEGFKSADDLKIKAGMSTYDLDFKDANESGVLRFNQDNVGALGIDNSQAASMSPGYSVSMLGASYNPLLLTNPLNRYDQRYKPGTPDERMTFYTGERAHISKGERQLQAREMATSEYAKERRQLQQMANDAANKTPHNPRAGVAEFKRGFLEVQPNVSDTFSENQAGRHDVNENFVERVNLTTDRDLGRMRDIQQAVKYEDSPVIDEIKSNQFNTNVIRKVHTDNGDSKLFGTDKARQPVGFSAGLGGLYETFKNFVNKDALLKDIVQGSLSAKDRQTYTKDYKSNTLQTQDLEDLDLKLGTDKQLSDERYQNKKDYENAIRMTQLAEKIKLGLATEQEKQDFRMLANRDYINTIRMAQLAEKIKLGLATEKEISDYRMLANKDYKQNISSYKDISQQLKLGLGSDKSQHDERFSSKLDQSKHHVLGSNSIKDPKLELGLESVKKMDDARIVTKKDYREQSVVQKFVKSIKSGLGLETETHEEDVRYDTALKVGYTKQVFEDKQLRDRLKELAVRQHEFDILTGKYSVYENGRHKDFSNSTTQTTEIVEPMSLLQTENGTVVRTIVVKEGEVCKLIQMRQTGDYKEFVTGSMPTEMLEGILGHGLKVLDDSNSRFNNLVGLNTHDHVAINIILEEMPEKMKLESARPLNTYQRDLLDTTLPKIGCITETKIIAQQFNEDHRGDTITAKQIASDRTENVQRIIQTQNLKEDRQQVSRDWQKQNFAKDNNPAKYTARFNDL